MHQYSIAFIDNGNCDIETVTVSASDFTTAIHWGWIKYYDAGHEYADVVEIRIEKLNVVRT